MMAKTQPAATSYHSANSDRNFKEYVQFSQTDGGAISISVTHENAQLAAQYANSSWNRCEYLLKKKIEKIKTLG